MILHQLQNEFLKHIKKTLLEVYPSLESVQSLFIELPKENSYGDFAIPLFNIIKELKISPIDLIEQISTQLEQFNPLLKCKLINTYLNISFERTGLTKKILEEMLQKKEQFYQSDILNNEKIIIEFSSPNTNKPLHLGHLRNDCLGESISRLLKNAKADVVKVNIINDRGIHICKSMLAYQKLGNDETPESTNMKSDHFVGKYYVLYNNLEKETPEIEQEAQKMLIAWENNNPEILKLWKKMNNWAINGIQETYDKTLIGFDKIYFESETYKDGKNIVLDALNKRIFFKAEDGSIRLKIPQCIISNEKGLAQDKIFLRADQTSVYITQDLGTIVQRYKDFNFSKHIYVVASEQNYHFQVLFYALDKLGFTWAKNLYHLSYGMVNLPDGKMKSREGTVVDADDLIKNLTKLAEKEISDKGRTHVIQENTPSKIALAALNYYLLKISPTKNIIFNPKQSIDFMGNTGPYLQYTLVRIYSILRKKEAQEALQKNNNLDASLLVSEDEWLIIKLVDNMSTIIIKATQELAPNLIANAIYDIAKIYNKYYHDTPVLVTDNSELLVARCLLTQTVEVCIRVGLYLLNIPILERM